ncbi:MAG: tetratricopeptide repeat protein [Limnohabitans sp.]
MKFRIKAAAVACSLLGLLPATWASEADATVKSALDGPLFYQLLLGELQVRQGSPGAGFSIVLEAARRTRDPALYQRAVDIALQNRSGEAATQAAKAWREDLPQSQEPLRYLLQIHLALGQLEEAGNTLEASIAGLPAEEQAAAIASIPRVFARVPDKALATRTVETALSRSLKNPATAPSAWTTIGRMRRDSGQLSRAVDAALQGHAANSTAPGPLVLAISLLESGDERLQPMLDQAMQGQVPADLWLGYVQALLASHETAHARGQLDRLLERHPDHAPAWLVSGLLRMDKGQTLLGQRELEHYLALQGRAGQTAEPQGRVDALLALTRAALGQGLLDQARRWLDQLPAQAPALRVAPVRAELLAREGEPRKAREVFRQLEASTPQEQRQNILAYAQWLREQAAWQEAYDLVQAAIAQPLPQGQQGQHELLNELALICEKLQRHDEMEQLLRQVIRLRPLDPQAYNALGYSLADRNVRLAEARELIEKAVELAPRDPFIRDSLGWLAFRQGRMEEARQLLEAAFKTRPDAEIAAHLGEVLWQTGQQSAALDIWRQGLALNGENNTLRDTLKRLQVQP